MDYSNRDIEKDIQLKELSNTDYKNLVKKYKNSLDKINYPKEPFIPCEAFENSEEILKIPKTSIGRTLPIAVNFFMNKIKDKKELDEEEETYSFLEHLHEFLY